jgi:hypothetical protein
LKQNQYGKQDSQRFLQIFSGHPILFKKIGKKLSELPPIVEFLPRSPLF